MDMDMFAPYPLSKFKQMNKIRELTKYSPVIDVFNSKEILDVRSDVINEVDDDDDDDKTTNSTFSNKVFDDDAIKPSPSKKHKFEESNYDLSDEDECVKIDKTPNELLNNGQQEMSLSELKKFLVSMSSENACDKKRVNLICEKLLSKSIVHHKNEIESIFDDLMSFLHAFPEVAFNFSFNIINENELENEVIALLKSNLLTEDQKKMLFAKWLSSHIIDGSNTRIVDTLLWQYSNFYEDSHLMGLLAESLVKNLSQERDKCPKFSKFLLQIVTKISSCVEESVFTTLKNVIESNKTFLRKRMEVELNKKH